MALKDIIENALGLGRSEDVRRIPVGVTRARTNRAIVSTPGARLHITRDHRDPETARLLLWCVRNGVAMELADGSPAIRLDGQLATASEARRLLAAG